MFNITVYGPGSKETSYLANGKHARKLARGFALAELILLGSCDIWNLADGTIIEISKQCK